MQYYPIITTNRNGQFFIKFVERVHGPVETDYNELWSMPLSDFTEKLALEVQETAKKQKPWYPKVPTHF